MCAGSLELLLLLLLELAHVLWSSIARATMTGARSATQIPSRQLATSPLASEQNWSVWRTRRGARSMGRPDELVRPPEVGPEVGLEEARLSRV